MRCVMHSTRARCWKAIRHEPAGGTRSFRRIRRTPRSGSCVLTLDAGEKLALVGESGSGKTVTALSLLRLVEAARLSGEIIFDGKDVLKMPEAALRELRGRDIAVIFQEPMTALNPIYSVGDQIAESL